MVVIPMSMTLDQASLCDSDRIAEILIASRREHMSYVPFQHSEQEVRNWIRDHLIPSCRVTLASNAGEVVGVLAVSEADGVSWIEQMYVTPQCVGMGIGGTLISHAIKALPRPIRLYTFQNNSKARRFYERYGFRAISFTNGERNEEGCPDVLYELS